VHCLCALLVCTVCVHCLCALLVCTVCVHCLCALFVCTVCVHCLSPRILIQFDIRCSHQAVAGFSFRRSLRNGKKTPYVEIPSVRLDPLSATKTLLGFMKFCAGRSSASSGKHLCRQIGPSDGHAFFTGVNFFPHFTY
jgi:hypothetical protein